MISPTSDRYSLSHGGILIVLNGPLSLFTILLFPLFETLIVFVRLLFSLVGLYLDSQFIDFVLVYFVLLISVFPNNVRSKSKLIWCRNMFVSLFRLNILVFNDKLIKAACHSKGRHGSHFKI